ncbi:tape measure protein [Paenochrobactrum sp. BZR 588]|uniref:tape measure protein n=1 Tax=unclassified Paenochrobactrum TaxID=2639760 RepID=UPI0038549B77
MAEDSDDIILSISADVAALRRSQKKMEEAVNGFSKSADKRFQAVSKSADNNFKAIERNAQKLRRELDGIFQKPMAGIGGIAGGIGAVLGTNELRKMTDTWTDLTSRVNLAAGSIENGTEVMGRLGQMARRTYSDLEQTTESYLANSTALKDLGYSTNQSLDYTEALNNALVVSGAKGDKAARVIDALSKAMAVGKLSGTNLNTVIESGGRVAEALAESLGTTVSGLRGLGAQGKITGNDIVKGLSGQLEKLRKEAESMPATISDGFTLLNNALLEYVGNADTATGVSAKVSEALIIIADNFDKVADAGLQVAAVFAGALVGRSLMGMIRTLGMTTTEVLKLTRALNAAKGAGGVVTALGGMGAAAGPLGAIVGGALVFAMTKYTLSTMEAKQNSDALRTEMEKLGLVAPRVADAVDGVTESLDKLSAADKARKLKKIADELDRLRNGGPLSRLFGQGDELDALAGYTKQPLQNLYQNLSMPEADKSARREILKIIAEFQGFEINADKVKQKLEAINNTPISDAVVELTKRVQETVDHMSGLQAMSTRVGDMPELTIATQKVQDLADHLDMLATKGEIKPQLKADTQEIIDKFVKAGGSADDALTAINNLSQANPNMSAFFEKMASAIKVLANVRDAAREAGQAMAGAYPRGPDENKQARSSLDPYIQQRKAENEAAKAFEQNAIRRTKLTKDQLALENKIAEVRKRLETEGIKNPEKGLAERIAQAELAADKARSGEGKKPKSEKSHQKTTEQQIDTDIQAVRDRTAALQSEIAAVGMSYQENEKRKISLDLEQAALAKLRDEAIKKGQTDLSGIKLSEQQRQKIEEVSAAYAQQAEELRRVQEKQQDVEQASADFYQTFKSGTLDAITGAKSLSDALSDILNKLAQMLLNSAFDALFKPSSGGVAGGTFGSAFDFIGGLLGRKDGGSVTEVPGGGRISGAGGPRDDKVLLRASNGEYIMNADATAKYGWLLEAMNKGQLPALRDGGAVGVPNIRTPSIPLPRVPDISSPAERKETGPQEITISVDVSGARGNQEIEQMVQQGVQRGIKGFSESNHFVNLVGRSVVQAQSRGVIR